MVSGYLLAGFVVLAFGGFAIWWLWQRSARSMPLTALDVILIWPVLFAAARGSRPAARLSAKILVGLVLLALLAGVYLAITD